LSLRHPTGRRSSLPLEAFLAERLLGYDMHIPDPLPLGVRTEAFNDPDWVYEIKHDGFRALAVIERGQCRFISRKKHKLFGLRDLAAAIAREVNAETAILDGELAVPDHHGRTVFAWMMKRRHEARYFAFDLISLNGDDLRNLPLLTRKAKLRRLLPARSAHVLYVDHTKGAGQRMYELVCQLDLEGIVAKRAASPYGQNANGEDWIKIKNPAYSQKEGRGDLFKRAG
jgi:bifunctional non-homologous end joining protein LigD